MAAAAATTTTTTMTTKRITAQLVIVVLSLAAETAKACEELLVERVAHAVPELKILPTWSKVAATLGACDKSEPQRLAEASLLVLEKGALPNGRALAAIRRVADGLRIERMELAQRWADQAMDLDARPLFLRISNLQLSAAHTALEKRAAIEMLLQRLDASLAQTIKSALSAIERLRGPPPKVDLSPFSRPEEEEINNRVDESHSPQQLFKIFVATRETTSTSTTTESPILLLETRPDSSKQKPVEVATVTNPQNRLLVDAENLRKMSAPKSDGLNDLLAPRPSLWRDAAGLLDVARQFALVPGPHQQAMAPLLLMVPPAMHAAMLAAGNTNPRRPSDLGAIVPVNARSSSLPTQIGFPFEQNNGQGI